MLYAFDIRSRIANSRRGMAQTARISSVSPSIAQRIGALNWDSAAKSLSERGHAVTSSILTPTECDSLVALYNDASRFRSHIIMERYRFGIGDYKYFANPLPELVTELRSAAYPHLAEVANHWAGALADTVHQYPRDHEAFLKTCRKAGQAKPTPLMLHYDAGGFNCLHPDLYGEDSVPLQTLFLLGQQARAWAGAELLI